MQNNDTEDASSHWSPRSPRSPRSSLSTSNSEVFSQSNPHCRLSLSPFRTSSLTIESVRMKTIMILIVAALCLLQVLNVNAFVTPSRSVAPSTSTSTQLFFFGGPKDDGSPGDYVCKDCGYVFTKGPKAWAALPDNYSCPPCGAIKRRFTKVPKGSASGKVEVKKSWF
jgi:rubredoxin